MRAGVPVVGEPGLPALGARSAFRAWSRGGPFSRRGHRGRRGEGPAQRAREGSDPPGRTPAFRSSRGRRGCWWPRLPLTR